MKINLSSEGRFIAGCALTGGLIAAYLVAVGIYAAFAARPIIAQTVSLGHLMLFSIWFATGWFCATRFAGRSTTGFLAGTFAGLASGLIYATILEIARQINFQATFVALSPTTLNSALGGQTGLLAFTYLGLAGTLAAAMGFALANLNPRLRGALISISIAIVLGALLKDLWVTFVSNIVGNRRWSSMIFAGGGLTWWGVAAAASVGAAWQGLSKSKTLVGTARRRTLLTIVGSLVITVIIPYMTNAFVAQVMLLVGLYALMGMGLNIELGLAGLLDLGFVAFFAIGAYMTALLTADTGLALANLTFWEALPLATLCAAFGGFVFGLPVLRVRGDYLALATLGLGEIVRLLVVSDMMAPVLGGAQGIVAIPRPALGETPMTSQLSMYYLTLILTALVALAGYRLHHSPIGRAWMAAREDEDAAETLGIDLVQSKLRAYVLGAAFAGVAGAIFASTLGSVFPQSFRLDVSINILALLVVGGLGSLPGVFVGSLILIGLPEFLREFGEFRYLFYGVLLILVMRVRPEGLWPSNLKRMEA